VNVALSVVTIKFADTAPDSTLYQSSQPSADRAIRTAEYTLQWGPSAWNRDRLIVIAGSCKDVSDQQSS
jgi:hypothetical protein